MIIIILNILFVVVFLFFMFNRLDNKKGLQVMVKNLQEWLIAVALMIVIPTTVYLGCRLISPKPHGAEYTKSYQEFMKGYSYKDHEKYKERMKEWEHSEIYRNNAQKKCDRKFNFLMIAGPLSVVSFYIGSTFVMPVVGAGLVITGLSLLTMYSYSYSSCKMFPGMMTLWLELLFLFASLVIVIVASYKASEE